MSNDRLTDEQQRAVKTLLEFTGPGRRQAADRSRASHIAAVIGPRGVGKSTVLVRLREQLAQQSVLVTELLDAATVREDLGLMAAAVHALFDTLPPRYREGEGGPAKELRKRFDHCIESALMQEDSYRQMAQELAMSPLHYTQIVCEASRRRQAYGDDFGAFVEAMSRAIAAGRDGRGAGDEGLFVVLIDDLDLAEAGSVRKWVRGMLASHGDHRIAWVLSFDRGPLVRALARELPAESVPPEARMRGQDLVSGRSLLSKLVPSRWQIELRPWDFRARPGFCPLTNGAGGPGPDNLGTLLTKRGLHSMLPLLPASPRALMGLFQWLELQDGADGNLAARASAFLRQIAVEEGADVLLQRLDRSGADRVAAGMKWEATAVLSDSAWNAVMGSARTEGPLWSLPLPEGFSDLAISVEPEALTEAILDLALQAGTLTPYQLLARMPFTEPRLQRSRCLLRLPENEVVDYFSRANQQVAAALAWQHWKEEKDASGLWSVEIGPAALWSAIYGLRPAAPRELLRALLLPLIASAPQSVTDGAASSFLPRRFRALLTLVEQVRSCAWGELEQLLRLWSPLTFTRCVAAMTLRAYAEELGLEKPPWLLIQTQPERVHLLANLKEDEIERQYQELLTGLGQHLDARPARSPDEPPTVKALVQEELASALKALLQLPVVQGLAAGT
jgi:hypothetical protein